MDINHGFVVQKSIIPLDLSPSKTKYPTAFITSLNNYLKESDKKCVEHSSTDQSISVVYWEYFDAYRETFENNIFEQYEQNLRKQPSIDKIKGYLRTCKIMCRCSDFDESMRIFHLLVNMLLDEAVGDSEVIADFLETVCVTTETIKSIFVEKENLKYLDFLLHHLCRVKRDVFGFWKDSSSRSKSDCDLISQFLYHGYYDNASICLNYGLQWKFCEDVYIDYSKALNSSWTTDVLTQFEGLQQTRSIDRNFLIMQTFFLVKDCKFNRVQNIFEYLRLVWRSIPDAFVTSTEMLSFLSSLVATSKEMEQGIAENTELYRQLFLDNMKEKYSPRALKDLCRCSIRSRLAKNFQLPYGICEINLPYRMEMFLKLQI